MRKQLGDVSAIPSKRLYSSIIADYDLHRSICELIDNAVDLWILSRRSGCLQIKIDINTQQQVILKNVKVYKHDDRFEYEITNYDLKDSDADWVISKDGNATFQNFTIAQRRDGTHFMYDLNTSYIWETIIDSCTDGEWIHFTGGRYEIDTTLNLDFADDSFDAIFMYDTLQHVAHREEALNECIRVIKPDGVICVIEWNERSIQADEAQYGFTIDYIDPRTILQRDDVSIEVLVGTWVNAFLIRRKAS